MADPLPVVPARENLRTVVESNTLGGRVSGNETVPIDSLFGVTSPSKRAQDAITDIVSQMSGPEGYIERLIVDQDGNVIEGAHRLEALRRLGISEVPITRIVDPTANLDLPSLQDAIRGVGKIHPDHVNQIMSQVGDMLASTGNNPEKVLEEYTFPEGYEKYFEAALNSVSLGKPRPTDQPGPEEPTTPPGWSPYETPAGNLARNIPAVLDRDGVLNLKGVPLISEILRLWYDERLPEQRPEETGRGRWLQTRQGKGQILRKILKGVGKTNLPLRILDSVERYYSLLSPGQQEGLGEFLQTFAEYAGPTVIPPKVWEKIVGTVAKPQQGIASLGEAMGISEDDLLRNPWPVDDLPLTGAQRGELLNLYKTRTWKSKPRNAVNDLVRNEYWPEELRSDGIAFLEGSAKFGSARQRRVYDQKPDPLASRQPGHAIRKFEAKKRHKLEEEARRSNEAAIRERGEALQGLDEEGLWNKKAVGEIASRMNLIEHMGIGYLQREIARANMEAVPRALKKEGWTVRYASKGRDKRRSSRYIVSPDRRFEVRLSDHYLPDTPEREYMHSQTGGPRWDEDIVVSGTESPRSIIDEIKDLYIKSVDDREGYVSGGFVDKPLYESARLIG